MPFEKKKKYKTSADYKQKSIYIDEDDTYQQECLRLLDLCGHKQSKFLGLLAHDLIQRMGLNVDILDRESFRQVINILELQVSRGINNPFIQPTTVMQPLVYQQPVSAPVNIKAYAPKNMEQNRNEEDDDFIKQEDLNDMNDALAAFGA